MNPAKYLLIVLLAIGGFICGGPASAQGDATYIKFNFQHSLRIPDHFVRVEIERQQDKVIVKVKSDPMAGHEKEWTHTRKDTAFSITVVEFEKLVESVTQANCTAWSGKLDSGGLDGTTCQIEYGNLQSSIACKVWSPDYNTQKRNLQAYLEACKLIIATAGLKPESIL